MPISVPPGDVESGTRELRLALVCYGGVSLAIYMHGVTKELQSVFLASEGYAQSQNEKGDPQPADNPYEPRTTMHAYWEALRQAHHRGDGTPATRVVVDILSGTSAGGINGIVLAKALSRGESQEKLRDVWLNQGNIVKLLNPVAGAPGGFLDRLKTTARTLWNGRKGPLNGNFLLQQVYEALEAMDTGRDGAEPRSQRGSGPSPWPVELHVTLTDLMGFPQAAPAWDPKAVKDRRHRYVLSFRTRDEQFARDDNRALAFAARATSSFPGAFPPTRIADIEELGKPWDGLEAFLREYWEIYELSDARPQQTAFVDGGVLDNAPFDLAIKGIEERPATAEVDRKLIYIQPDPVEVERADGDIPGLAKIVWRGFAGIPRREPILNDLLRIRARNEGVRRVAEALAAAEAHADRLPEPPELEGMDEAEQDVQALLEDEAMTLASYRQIKLFSVVDRLAQVASELCNFPPDSDYALFVSDVLVAWARDRELLALGDAAWQNEQLPFLRAFDLGYRERRIRFIIRLLNALYGSEPPSRDALDALKKDMYTAVWRLSSLAAAARQQGRAAALEQLFARERVRAYLNQPGTPDENVNAFLHAHGRELDDVRAELQTFLGKELAGFSKSVYKLLIKHTADGWPDEVRTRLRRAYVAFPVYDAMLFPIRALSDLGELDRVEVIRLSPLDATLIPVPGARQNPPLVADKLEGEAAHHFAAFFARKKRENDYLWGRLDAVERLIWLILEDAPSRAYKLGFKAVLDEERDSLEAVSGLVVQLMTNVEALPDELASIRS